MINDFHNNDDDDDDKNNNNDNNVTTLMITIGINNNCFIGQSWLLAGTIHILDLVAGCQVWISTLNR